MKYLVTGVSRGLGLAITHQLLAAGHEVIGISRTRPALSHPSFSFYELDLGDDVALTVFLRDLEGLKIDRVILNAARIEEDIVDGMWDFARCEAILRVNFLANLRILSVVLPYFVRRGSGRVCGISSMSALVPIGVKGVGYAASKAGLSTALESLRRHLPLKGISITDVYLGRAQPQRAFSVLSYDYCAKAIIAGVEAGRPVLTLPRWKFWVLSLLRLRVSIPWKTNLSLQN